MGSEPTVPIRIVVQPPRERPILFSAPMVRAILDGTKTMTRRVVRVRYGQFVGPDGSGRWWLMDEMDPDADGNVFGDEWSYARCPYGKPGDRLWVRESIYSDGDGVIRYRSDDRPVFVPADKSRPRGAVLRSPIYLPRWASRITLEITDVRVQRLQDISEADACAEGLGSPITRDCKVTKFARLWDDIHGRYAWSDNPWVWAITFKRIEAQTARGAV